MSLPRADTNKPTVLIFGPLSRSLSQSNLSTLRTAIRSSPQHAWVEHAIDSLSTQYQTLVTECPALHDTVNKTQIDSLAAWLKTDDLVLDIDQLPNLLLAPLVVVEQLVQYRAVRQLYKTILQLKRQSGSAWACLARLLSLSRISQAMRTLNGMLVQQSVWQCLLVLQWTSNFCRIPGVLRRPCLSHGSALIQRTRPRIYKTF